MATESDAKGFVPKVSVSTTRCVTLEPEPHLKSRRNSALEIPSTLIKTTTNIKIERTEQICPIYKERFHLLLSELEYPRRGSNPGYVLIFNQVKFEDYKRRAGSTRDVNEITLCMGRLGFNIDDSHIHTDYTSDQIIATINEIIESDKLRDANSLIVFFLTHGDSLDFLFTQDSQIRASEIWDKFAKCKHLKGKPKFFVFQACKGEKRSVAASATTIPGADDPVIKHDLVSDQTFTANHLGPDMLIAFATTEGNVSFRHTTLGSWFIQELCRNFISYGRRDDVVSLIIRTTKCVCGNYFTVEQGQVKKQMPLFVSTLTRKFYLNRTKERNVLLRFLNEHERIKDHIKDIENRIEDIIRDQESRR